MIQRIRTHFPDSYIDEIRDDPTDNYFTPILRVVLDHVGKPDNVCDVGCGNGVYSIAIKRETGCRLVGVDGSRHALKQARALGFDELHEIEDFSFDRLPFRDAAFDLVLNKDVLEHLLHPEHLVGEIARIVRPGGYALIHVPNHFPVVGRLRLLFRNTIDPFGYFPDADRWNFPHIRFFTKESLTSLADRYGLEAVEDFSHQFLVPAGIFRFFSQESRKRFCAHFPNAWTEGFTLLFRKPG